MCIYIQCIYFIKLVPVNWERQIVLSPKYLSHFYGSFNTNTQTCVRRLLSLKTKISWEGLKVLSFFSQLFGT